MGSVQTGIDMRDQFSNVLMAFTNNMMAAVTAANNFSDVMNQDISTAGLDSVRDEIQSVMDDLNSLNRAAVAPVQPAVASDSLQMNFSGVQQVRDLNGQIEQTQALLQRVSDVQQTISTAGRNAVVLPDDVEARLQAANSRLMQMQEAMNMISQNPFDLPTEAVEAQLVSLQGRIRETVQEQLELQETLSNMDIEREQPPPVKWQTDNLNVFTGSGIERFRQEVQSANEMMLQLGDTQRRIAIKASGMDILPPSVVQDMDSLAERLGNLTERMGQIENNPLNLGTDQASNGMEQIRSQMDQALQLQNEMNSAIERMDIQGANAAYLQLSQTIGGTERYIRDNVNEQGAFNSAVSEGIGQADGLAGAIKRAAAAYLTVNTVKSTLNASDELMQTTSRLDMMNDGLQSTQELTDMVYIAAQDARGKFNDMADVVARFGNNAKDAFSSSEEVVQFAGLIQKQMTIAGASAQEAANAELQLSQALGSGVLRGDELNSIFDQAPNLIQNIADYLNVPIGKIREMAADGKLSADVVKQSIFAAADDINAKFESMPVTWDQTWTSMQNTAVMAFQPVLVKLNEIANSEQFQALMTNAVNAMAFVAGAVLQVFGLMGEAGQFAADHWDVLSPIIYTVVGALAAYALYLGITNTIQAVSTAVKIAAAVASYAHAAATGTEASATAAATAAQYGLNTALLSCPLTWIILLIIALIAVVIAVENHIANMGGTATTTFGVITGGGNVVIQFFKNLGLEAANIALGIGNAIAALASNMKTAFHNAICSIQSWWYGLLSDCLTVIEGICAALNKLPFVNFDYSGISSAADDYAAKAAKAAGNKESYTNIADAFYDGVTTFDAYGNGWTADAYRSGAEWGDGVSDKISDTLNGFSADLPQQPDYANTVAGAGNSAADMANAAMVNNSAATAKNTGDTAKAAQKAAQSLDVTGENLKYIKDMAERDYINRFTTAKISIKQTNHNTVKNDMDLDGINEYLRSDLEQRMAATAEGVH
ncbi:MAG: tape measure protein [Ruminococcus flavefaciens]|nr:tape measure protein [Ruminococcus flavefaciens]